MWFLHVKFLKNQEQIEKNMKCILTLGDSRWDPSFNGMSISWPTLGEGGAWLVPPSLELLLLLEFVLSVAVTSSVVFAVEF